MTFKAIARAAGFSVRHDAFGTFYWQQNYVETEDKVCTDWCTKYYDTPEQAYEDCCRVCGLVEFEEGE